MRHLRFALCGLVLTLLAVGLPARAALLSDEELEEDHKLSLEFETPHTDWAQPYAQGKIRVLFISNGRGTNARHMVELMQRFDIEAQAVYWCHIVDTPTQIWHGEANGEKRILRLLEEPWDCYLFNGIPLTHLGTEMQHKLLKPVTEGAGIVLMGVKDDRVLKAENELAERPPLLASVPEAKAFSVAQGRGVSFPQPPDTPYRVGWEWGYDHWQEKLGRAVLWAAGREPEVDLTIEAAREKIDRDDLPEAAVTVRCVNRGERRELAAELRLRRDDGLVVRAETLRSGAARPDWTWEVPVLRAGGYYVDVRVTSRRGVEAFGTTSFEVTSPRGIEAVELAKPWGEVGDELVATVKLTGEPAGVNERLRMQLLDRRGRVLAQSEPVGPEADGEFRFELKPWMPMLLRATAALTDGDREIASAYQYFRVTKRNRGRFNFLVWDYPKGSLAPYGEESLARLGMTLQLCGGSPPEYVAAHDVAWVPYTTRIMAPHDEQGIMKPMCWNDEPKVSEYIQGLAENYEPARGHGVFVYSLGDETVTRGACVHPACLDTYREYLEQEYRKIEALNASWGTDFASFDDVTLSQPDDNNEAQALRDENYPRWYDRQAFKCYNFVQFCRKFGEEYEKLDPQAKTGFEGAGRFRDGDDFDLIVRTNGFWSPYPGPGDEVIRSIAPRGFPRSNWMGYTRDADSLLAKYWRMVIRGSDAVWYWRWDNIGRFHGLLAPHLGPFTAVKDITRDTQVLRDGLGDVLYHSEMQDDGIALLYSMPSAYANRVEAGPSYGSFHDAHAAWHEALRELGLQFRYVTDRMLRLGEFDTGRFKVLILPQTEALGPREAFVIEEFVRQGGTVIADVRPGLYDGHCKPLETGALDALFGIERTDSPEAQAATAAVQGTVSGRAIGLSWEQAKCDAGIAPRDCQPLGEADGVPLVLVRETGQGQAILLNFAMSSFPHLGQEGTPEEAADLIAELLGSASVEPAVRLRDESGQRLRGVEAVRWQNGELELMGLFRETGDPVTARVELPQPRVVWNLREGKALGKAGRFTVPIRPSRATFLVLAPSKLPPPRVALSAGSAERGETVTVALSVPGAGGLHGLRVRVTTPDGTPADWLDQVAVADAKGTNVTWPLAFNDPAGRWTLTATDVYSGQVAQAQLAVQ